jgi:hypothetical protein
MLRRKVVYKGIDGWNRPIFIGDDGKYYGSTEKLFSYLDEKKKVLNDITETDLTFFGYKFGCEPMGSPPELPLEIVRK